MRLDDTNDERSKRVATVEALRAQAAELRTTMGYPTPGASAGSGAISLAALAAAEADVSELDRERGRRTAVLHECRDFISELRTKLELPESEWAKLPDGDDDLSQAVLEAFQAEIERLEELKFAKLGPLVRAARQRLRPLWNELCLSEEERCANEAAWGPAEGEEGASAEALETALQEVEEEEAKLKAKLESMGKVRLRSECDLRVICVPSECLLSTF